MAKLIQAVSRYGPRIDLLPTVGIFSPSVNREGEITVNFRVDRNLNAGLNERNFLPAGRFERLKIFFERLKINFQPLKRVV